MIKVGIIGTDKAAETHAKAIQEVQGASLWSVVWYTDGGSISLLNIYGH